MDVDARTGTGTGTGGAVGRFTRRRGSAVRSSVHTPGSAALQCFDTPRAPVSGGAHTANARLSRQSVMLSVGDASGDSGKGGSWIVRWCGLDAEVGKGCVWSYGVYAALAGRLQGMRGMHGGRVDGAARRLGDDGGEVRRAGEGC